MSAVSATKQQLLRRLEKAIRKELRSGKTAVIGTRNTSQSFTTKQNSSTDNSSSNSSLSPSALIHQSGRRTRNCLIGPKWNIAVVGKSRSDSRSSRVKNNTKKRQTGNLKTTFHGAIYPSRDAPDIRVSRRLLHKTIWM